MNKSMLLFFVILALSTACNSHLPQTVAGYDNAKLVLSDKDFEGAVDTIDTKNEILVFNTILPQSPFSLMYMSKIDDTGVITEFQPINNVDNNNEGFSPRVSPLGNYIVYYYRDTPYLYHLLDGTTTPIIINGWIMGWMPDEDGLLVLNTGPNVQILRYTLNGETNLIWESNEQANVDFRNIKEMTISSDKKSIVMVFSEQFDRSDVYVLDVTSSRLRQITTTPNVLESQIQFLPNNNGFIFISDYLDRDRGISRISVSDLEGKCIKDIPEPVNIWDFSFMERQKNIIIGSYGGLYMMNDQNLESVLKVVFMDCK